MAAYLSALLVCMKPLNLLLIFAMVALGIVFGAIPGLSATLGIALLLPITFGLSTETSFVMLLAIWIGGVSGTFISAVLIGIPGSSSAIATCFDGYPMTQKGQASKALGIGMTASFIGTVCSVAIATVLSPVIAEAALHLGPWEYFSLCFCAITLIASLSKGNIFKGIMSAGIGLLMGCVGMDPINGATRFTFGNVYLTSGISTVAQMLGMFAMCQIIRDNAKGEAKMPDVDVKNMKGLGIGFKDIIENSKTIIFAFASGLWIGFLPGMGSGISNMVAYGYAKGISKDPESFGKGNPAGVWASETANNASLGGALIPMMALGIPGDGITAMLIAGLTIHGLQAGPLFMTEQPDLAMLIFACVMVSAIVTYLIQIVTKRWFPYILKIPYHYLYTVILVISFIGGYAGDHGRPHRPLPHTVHVRLRAVARHAGTVPAVPVHERCRSAHQPAGAGVHPVQQAGAVLPSGHQLRPRQLCPLLYPSHLPDPADHLGTLRVLALHLRSSEGEEGGKEPCPHCRKCGRER